MKKQSLQAISLVAIMFLAPLALAEKIPDGDVPMTKALENLQAKGFKVVKKIEFDNGMYTAKAVNADGRTVKIRINAKTGNVVLTQKNQERLTALDVAKKVETAGYHSIYKIDMEWIHDRYEVKAYDKNGKKVELDVDAKSGHINKD